MFFGVYMGLGQRLKLRRQQLQLTQADLAKKVGVRQSTIGNLESRGGNTSKYAPKIAEVLNVPLEWLLFDNEEISPKVNDGYEFANELHLMLERFQTLFEIHKIPLAKIPTILDGGLKRSDILQKERLIDKLNDEVVKSICKLFHIEENWLLGVSERIYKNRRWNKFELHCICSQILRYISKGYDTEVIFTGNQELNKNIFKKARLDSDKHNVWLGVVIRLTKNINGVTFTTYEVWNDLPWEVTSARMSIKALILFCVRHQIEQCSYDLGNDEFTELFNKKKLAFNFFDKVRSPTWYPDDFLSKSSDDNPDVDEVKFIKEEYLERGLDELTKQFNNLDTGV